jgi:ion channel POLLUX/CASTOR
MRKTTVRERLRYSFDNAMSRGPLALIAWLLLLSLGAVLVISLCLWAIGYAPQKTLLDQIWSFAITTMASFDPTEGTEWPARIATMLILCVGLFIFSSLTGTLTTGLDAKLTELREGRSRVIETGQTVILGWSEQIYAIVTELVIANQSQPRSCIVILGDRNKIEMEDDIRSRVGRTGRTRIIVRRGNPMDSAALDIVSLETAKSIIIVPPDNDQPDSDVIKTLLAITNAANRRTGPFNIVAAIRDPDNAEIARMVGGDDVEVIQTGNLVARVTAQTCRQAGLSIVYDELMRFSGNEFCFQSEPRLVGKTFGAAIHAYEDTTVVGVATAEGGILLNPPADRQIASGERIIAVSVDDTAVRLSGIERPEIRDDMIAAARPTAPPREHTLILGWNRHASTIIAELKRLTPPGSSITVVSPSAVALTGQGETSDAGDTTVTFQQLETTQRAVLEAIDFSGIDHTIILSDSDELGAQQADAKTLLTLLHLRDIAERGRHEFSIVSEMQDVRNQALTEGNRADDFVIGDRLVSLMLTQVSENRELSAVFADLFDAEGSEIYFKPAADYVKTGVALNFYTVVAAAMRRGQMAIGYRLHARSPDAAHGYGVVINPPKSALVHFSAQDQIIVLSRD